MTTGPATTTSPRARRAFSGDQFNTRIDGRLSNNLNIFGRYSFAKYSIDGPVAFGEGGGAELGTLGGESKVKNHSVAAGFDYTLNATTILDFRVGYYQYKVDVLPFDYGTTPATDAGIPGLELRRLQLRAAVGTRRRQQHQRPG